MTFKTLIYKNLILSLFPGILFNSNIDNSQTKELKIILTEEELENYYSYKPSIEDLKENLKNNQNISDEYKEYTKEFIELIEEKYPNFDFTVFNENLKQFNVIEITLKDIQKDHPNRQSFYRISNSSIYMHNEHKKEETKKYCYFHELWHMFNNMCITKDNITYYKSTTMGNPNGTALDEGMTTFLTEQIYSQDILNYVNQYDEIKMLYQIFGDELLNVYIDSGIDGIENLILKYVGYNEAHNLIYLINNESKDKNNSIEIYEILIKLYLKTNSINAEKNIEIYKILENLCYDINTKKQILTIYRDYMCNIEINDEIKITFDNQKYYKIDELYFVNINDKKYLINDQILIDYYKDGYIKNIYDEEKTYIGKSTITIDTFRDYIIYNAILFEENNGIIYINKNIIDENIGDKYVKSK